MDTPDSRELQRLIKQLNEVEQRIAKISGEKITVRFDGESDPEKIAKQFGDVGKAIQAVKTDLRRAENELATFTGTVGTVKTLIEEINSELKTLPNAFKKSLSAFKKIEGISNSLAYNQADLSNMSANDIKNQKARSDQYFQQLRFQKEDLKTQIESQHVDLLKLKRAAQADGLSKLQQERAEKAFLTKKEEYLASRELLGLAEGRGDLEQNINNSFDDQLKKIKNMNSGLGISGKIVEGIGGALEKLGFKGFSSEVDKAKEKMKKLSVELSQGGEKAVGLKGKFKVLGAGLGSLKDSLKGIFTDPLFYIGLLAKAVQKLGHLFTHIDKATSNIGKTLGSTREAASAMVVSLKGAAGASGDMFLNMDRMVDAQLKLNQLTGTRLRLSNQELADAAYLTELVGLQEEGLKNVFTASVLTGKSQEDLYNTVVDSNDSIYASNELFKEAASITGQIAMNLGNNPAAIAKAVGEAKRLGITLDQARSMAMGTLDFENSIQKEMEAQVLTGKAINLNRARELAFSGKFKEAAEDMLNQEGIREAFATGNVLAQQAAAEAVGMSVDQLADAYRNRERDAKLTERARQIQLQAGNETLTLEEARLKALRENQTISERISNATAKIGDIFGGMLVPLVEKVAKGMEFVAGFFGTAYETSNALTGETEKISGKVGQISDKVEKSTEKLSGLAKPMTGAFGVIKDYPVLSTLGALIGGGLAIKGLGKLKNTVLGKLGLGKLGTSGNPMHVTMSGASSSILDMLNPKKKGPGKILNKVKNFKIPKMPNMLKGIGPKLLKGSGILSLVGAGVDLVGNLSSVAQNEDKGIGDALARTLDENKFMALGAAIGSVVPGVGTLIGAGIGGILDFANKQVLGEKGMVTESLDTPLAIGGIVTKPTRALVGEAGPEAVIPLREFYAKMDELINVVKEGGDVVMDGRKVGSTLQLASYKL